MNQQQWADVDHYLSDLLAPSDPALDEALRASEEAGLPTINVSANQGKLLHVLARSLRARRILEIGTLGGYSTIWLARALEPGGRLITLEASHRHAQVARANLVRAGLSDSVEIRVGAALDTLPELERESEYSAAGPFDLVFIDADKQGIPEYFDWSLKLTRPGGLVLVDNVVREGAVIDAHSTDPAIQGVRRFNERLASEPRAAGTVIQTVGWKGYDGLAIVVVLP